MAAILTNPSLLSGSIRKKILSVVCLLTGVGSLITLWEQIPALFNQWLYDRDYSQIYLMGLSLRSGVYLYEPIPELARRFDPGFSHFLPHASAYPPIIALVGAPLSMLPYFWSVVVWLLWEAACLITATFLVFRHFGGRKASTAVLATLGVFVIWQPVSLDLFRGQIMLTILLLLTLSWLSFRSNHDVKAGLFLGLALALKFYGWPIFLLFLFTRRWKAVLASAGLFAFCNGLMALWLGLDVFRDYFLRVAPGVAQVWTADVYNFSVMSFGYRLIGPTASLPCLIVALCICMYAAQKARDMDHSFMVVLAASTVLAPISWIHYFVTLLPALCLVASRKCWGKGDMVFALVVATILFVGYIPLPRSSIWGMLPLVGLAGLIWLLQIPPVRNNAMQLEKGIYEAA